MQESSSSGSAPGLSIPSQPDLTFMPYRQPSSEDYPSTPTEREAVKRNNVRTKRSPILAPQRTHASNRPKPEIRSDQNATRNLPIISPNAIPAMSSSGSTSVSAEESVRALPSVQDSQSLRRSSRHYSLQVPRQRTARTGQVNPPRSCPHRDGRNRYTVPGCLDCLRTGVHNEGIDNAQSSEATARPFHSTSTPESVGGPFELPPGLDHTWKPLQESNSRYDPQFYEPNAHLLPPLPQWQVPFHMARAMAPGANPFLDPRTYYPRYNFGMPADFNPERSYAEPALGHDAFKTSHPLPLPTPRSPIKPATAPDSLPEQSDLPHQSHRPVISTVDDPVALVEAYLGAVRRAKERELIDANRILAYIDRRASATSRASHPPNVLSFIEPEGELDKSHEETAVTLDPHTTSSPMPTTNSSKPPESIIGGRMNMSSGCMTGLLAGRARSECDTTNDSGHDNSSRNGEPVENGVQSPTESALLNELISLRQDVAALRRQQSKFEFSKWLISTVSYTYTFCRRRFRNKPRPNTRRLEWICECGEDLFADLPITNDSEHQNMLDFLTHPAGGFREIDPGQATPSRLEGGTAQINFTVPQLGTNNSNNNQPATSTSGSFNSTYIGTDSSQNDGSSLHGPFAGIKYLEVCVNIGKYETKLAEIQVTSGPNTGAAICTDAHLFRKIYERYHDLRKQNWLRFLYRPAGIRFVHFGVQESYRVSFFSSDPLPPEEVIARKQYEYSLQPPVLPPIDSRTFLHYFYKHGVHSQSTSAKYVRRLPKKLGGSLIRSLGVDELREGWGIHIVEGPNKVAICWMLMVILVASFGVSLGYDLVTKSGDSGFAIGQWMVATLTVALSALYFSLEDEANSSHI